jgi:hypothetical protein
MRGEASGCFMFELLTRDYHLDNAFEWNQLDLDLRVPTPGMGRVVRGGNCPGKNKLEFRCAMRNTPSFTNILLYRHSVRMQRRLRIKKHNQPPCNSMKTFSV